MSIYKIMYVNLNNENFSGEKFRNTNPTKERVGGRTKKSLRVPRVEPLWSSVFHRLESTRITTVIEFLFLADIHFR